MRPNHRHLILALIVAPAMFAAPLLADDAVLPAAGPASPTAALAAPEPSAAAPAPSPAAPAPPDEGWTTHVGPTPATPSFFLRVWSEDDAGNITWELGGAAVLEERMALVEGSILGVVVPKESSTVQAGSESPPLKTIEPGMSVQEVTVGHQLSYELRSVGGDRFVVDLTVSSEEVQARSSFWVDRASSNFSAIVTGTLGRKLKVRTIRVGGKTHHMFVEIQQQ